MGFTNATSNTFPPTTLRPLYRIWRDWCIGDSLGYLNDNFLYLETLSNSLSSSKYDKTGGAINGNVTVIGTVDNNANLRLGDRGDNSFVHFHTNLSAIAWNKLVSAGDSAIIFSDGTKETGKLVIAPWSDREVGTQQGGAGIRIDSQGVVSIGAPGISYPGAAAYWSTVFGAGGAFGSNKVGFMWRLPSLYASVDNNLQWIISTSSDYRIKTNIQTFNSSLNEIKQLRPVKYDAITPEGEITNKNLTGLIAHEVQEIYPEVVLGTKDQVNEKGDPIYQTVNYAGLVPMLIKAVQELTAKVEELEAKLK